MGYFSVTFTAPPATADTVTLSILTRLVIDENGYPVGTEGGTQNYSGDGWNFDASNNTLTLTSGSYDFSGKGNALRPLNPDVRLVVESGATVVVPDPKPEPTPDPTPEAPTYTLTVKGGTFTYNGGEAMTSASVPVDAEVKVTLNQSAVPEGMVFDLWAIACWATRRSPTTRRALPSRRAARPGSSGSCCRFLSTGAPAPFHG